MKITDMDLMHQLTSMTLSFVQEVQNYARERGFIMLQEEPIIHLRTEERLRLTITQPIYIGESDIELTIVAYLEEGAKQEMVVESTFDLLLPEAALLNDLHQSLDRMRQHTITHFFVCVKGSKEDGIINDELSVVIRTIHQIGQKNTLHLWDQLLHQFSISQNLQRPWASSTPTCS